MRVLQGVQCQVAARLGVVVAEAVRGVGVRELVQAQRHQEAGDDEDEHPDVRERPHGVRGQPRQDSADGGERDDRQEDRAGPHRLVQGADAHESTLPSRLP